MLESMAMGTPLLVSSVGGGLELEDGVTGRVLPPKRPELWVSAAASCCATRSSWPIWARAQGVTAKFSDELYACMRRSGVLAQPPSATTGCSRRARHEGSPSGCRSPSRVVHFAKPASTGGALRILARQPHRRGERRRGVPDARAGRTA